jgi:hypothetical protein
MGTIRLFAPECAALLACLLAGTASAQSFDGTWRGELSCAKLSFTKVGQKVPIELVVSGGKVAFQRQVWDQKNVAVVGTESGAGEIAANGAITLTGAWQAASPQARYTYTSSYRGNLSGTSGRLDGVQIWVVDGATETRACSIQLKR